MTGRYRLRLAGDIAFCDHGGKPFRAVFLNYLLDCLEDYTELTVEALAERAQRGGPRDRQHLLEVYGLFASEYDYRPVEPKTLPHADFALGRAAGQARRLLHSYGAIQSLERLLGLVHEQGVILVNDYGMAQGTGADELEHQRFLLATFVGVSFPELKAYSGESGKCQWAEPAEESGGIYSRLLGQRPPAEAVARFQERFGKAAHEQCQEPLAKARECVKVGRFEMAATFYHQALERQPANWVLLSEVAMFLTFSLRDVKAGIDMAKVALSLNPTCSADLWCTLGDGLFEYGRVAEAKSAYRRALQVSEGDVRARYNLAFVHAREQDYPAALAVIAEGLALDRTGEYRERLLRKQQEVLAQVAVRHQQEYLLLVNLVSKHAAGPGMDQPGPQAETTEQNPDHGTNGARGSANGPSNGR